MVPGGSSMFLNVLRCSQMFPDVPRCSQMFLDVPRCSQTLSYVPRCSQMFLDVPRCSQVILNVPRCSQMFPDVPRCYQMFLDVPRCSYMIHVPRCSLWSSATSISDGIFSTIRGKGGLTQSGSPIQTTQQVGRPNLSRVHRSQSVFYFVPQDSHSQAGSTSSGWKLDNIIWRCQCHTQRQRHRASKAQHMLYIFFLKALGSRILNMTFVCVKSKKHKYAKCLKGPTYMLLKDIK